MSEEGIENLSREVREIYDTDENSISVYQFYKLSFLGHIAQSLKTIESYIIKEITEPVVEKVLTKSSYIAPNTNKKYNYKRKDGSNNTCRKCGGIISWDDYDKVNHPYPTHVDEDGNIMGDGGCPEYGGQD